MRLNKKGEKMKFKILTKNITPFLKEGEKHLAITFSHTGGGIGTSLVIKVAKDNKYAGVLKAIAKGKINIDNLCVRGNFTIEKVEGEGKKDKKIFTIYPKTFYKENDDFDSVIAIEPCSIAKRGFFPGEREDFIFLNGKIKITKLTKEVYMVDKEVVNTCDYIVLGGGGTCYNGLKVFISPSLTDEEVASFRKGDKVIENIAYYPLNTEEGLIYRKKRNKIVNLFAQCSFRGSSELVNRENVVASYYDYRSPRGAIGISEGAIIQAAGGQKIYHFKVTGRYDPEDKWYFVDFNTGEVRVEYANSNPFELCNLIKRLEGKGEDNEKESI